jgi:hypothetical protein
MIEIVQKCTSDEKRAGRSEVDDLMTALNTIRQPQVDHEEIHFSMGVWVMAFPNAR